MVAGNWKMNASTAGTEQLVSGIVDGVARSAGSTGSRSKCEVLVCPPFPYLQQVRNLLGGTDLVKLGAQDVDTNVSGAFTGAVSAPMLADCGCSYVIVGHSERRSLYGDSDELVALKAKAASDGALIPIVCIGESLQEREQDKTEQVLERQLCAVLDGCGIDMFDTALIAYEPVWAIGTGKTATPQQAQDTHAFVREIIKKQSGAIADSVRILYGGSVKGENASGLFSQIDIDGGLIGGASLAATDFLDIVTAA